MPTVAPLTQRYLGGRFGYFLFFSARGSGKGSPRRREEGGGRFLIENPSRGGLPGRAEGARGWEGVCGEFWAGGGVGGGLNIFFRGQNSHQDIVYELNSNRSNLSVFLGRYHRMPMYIKQGDKRIPSEFLATRLWSKERRSGWHSDPKNSKNGKKHAKMPRNVPKEV